MQQIVSITSQGQITIPALMRRLLSLDEYKKALVQTEENRIIIEPIPDILSLAGFLENRAFKNKTVNQIIELEEKAIAAGVVEKYL